MRNYILENAKKHIEELKNYDVIDIMCHPEHSKRIRGGLGMEKWELIGGSAKALPFGEGGRATARSGEVFPSSVSPPGCHLPRRGRLFSYLCNHCSFLSSIMILRGGDPHGG